MGALRLDPARRRAWRGEDELDLSLRELALLEAFMRRHRGSVSRAGVMSFLVFEAAFPRSLRYCTRSALGVARRIWPDSGVAGSAVERLASLDGWLGEREPEALSVNVHDLLTHVVDQVSLVCGEVQQAMAGESPAAREKVEEQRQRQG